MHIVLDISRLLGLAWHGQPSGVDRVEIAHARHWRALPESRVTFVAQSPWGWFAALPDGFARSLLTEADAVVAPGKEGGLARFRAMAAAALSRRLWGGGRWALGAGAAPRPEEGQHLPRHLAPGGPQGRRHRGGGGGRRALRAHAA